MTTAIEKTETQLAPRGTPSELLRIAVEQNLDIDKLTKLMDLQERWERNEARKAFIEAKNAFKAELPEIPRTGDGNYGAYPTLDDACTALTAKLSKHDFDHRWRIDEDRLDWIKVTCVLTHRAGHSDEFSMGGPPDTSGSKNAIQSRASTLSYLERYTLLGVTGTAAKGMDKDGNGSKIDDLKERLEFIANCRNVEELQKLFAVHYKAARELKDETAMKQIVAAKDKRRKELNV